MGKFISFPYIFAVSAATLSLGTIRLVTWGIEVGVNYFIGG